MRQVASLCNWLDAGAKPKVSEEWVIFPTPDAAIATNKADQSIAVNGKSQDMVVYDTTTWVRKDGVWVASAHTETVRQTIS